MALPDKIIDDLINDPDFVSMSEQEQDQLLQELDQEITGVIPKSENLLQRAINVAKPVGEFAEGFADVQTFGLNRLAGYGGKKLASLVVPGEEPPGYYDQPEQTMARGIGQSLPIGRGIQHIIKGGAKLAFPKFFAKRELPKATGKLTKSIQEVITKSKADPKNLGVSRDEVLKVLRAEYSKSKVPSGPQGALFRRWITKLEGSSSKTNLTADTINEMESAFGHVARFGQDAGSNPTLAQGAKVVNRYASKALDDISKKAGVPEFISRSLEKSKLLSTLGKKPSILTKLARFAIGGAATAGGGYGGYRVAKSVLD